jgi:hypothetical protein
MGNVSEKRLGRFSLNKEGLLNQQDIVRFIMSKMIIVRAEVSFRGSIEYVAISDLFEKVSEKEEIPSYTLRVKEKGILEAKRVGEV